MNHYVNYGTDEHFEIAPKPAISTGLREVTDDMELYNEILTLGINRENGRHIVPQMGIGRVPLVIAREVYVAALRVEDESKQLVKSVKKSYPSDWKDLTIG